MVKSGNRRNALRANRGRHVMNRAMLLLSLALPLAACGSKPAVEEKNASVEQVANSVREASHGQAMIRPGKWQSTMTIEQMDMPGMPPEAKD
jgi:hypothetical protein